MNIYYFAIEYILRLGGLFHNKKHPAFHVTEKL